jgi:Tfp pilus assembly protein PilF
MVRRVVSLSRRPWVGPVAVGLVALVLGLGHVLAIRGNPFFYHPIVDAFDYDNDAWYMVQSGDWAGGPAVYFQPPLFTYFLAAIYRVAGHDLLVPRLVQVVLGALTAAGVFLTARKIFGERAAWIAGLVTACYALLVFYEGELLAPTLTVFLCVAVLFALFSVVRDRSGWVWAVPGTILGLGAIATANVVATVPVFWVWAALEGRRGGRSGRRVAVALVAFTLGVSAAVAPVALRNWVVRQQAVPISSNAGLNFYLGNSGDYDAKVGLRPGAEWEDLMNLPLRAGVQRESEMSSFYFAEAWKYIRSHPADYLRLLARKVYLFLRGDEVLRNQEIYPFRAYSPVLRLLLWKVGLPGGMGLAFPFGVLLPMAWPGVVLALAKRHGEGLLLAAFAAVYSLTVVAFFVTARYRVPVAIPLALLAAYGLAQWRDIWAAPRLRVAAVVGLAGLGLVANWNPGRMSREMNPDAYYSLAATFVAQGDLAGAERNYRKAIELAPGDEAAWLNLGLEVYQQQGRLEEAEACYRRALSIRPGYALAVFDLGYLAEIGGRAAEAESLYREAMRLDPLMPGPCRNLAAAALSRGDYAGARDLYRQAHRLAPRDAAVLAGLGVTTFALDGLAPAREFFDQAVELEPDNPDTYFNLALVYMQSGMPSEAADAALRVTELAPRDDQAYLIYAQAMAAAGKPGTARAVLGAAAGRWPDLAGPRRALELLGNGSGRPPGY